MAQLYPHSTTNASAPKMFTDPSMSSYNIHKIEECIFVVPDYLLFNQHLGEIMKNALKPGGICISKGESR
jgi:hypothetical protein